MNIPGLLLLVHLTSGIGPPAFISEWIPIAANGAPSEVEITVAHNLSELPMKVDVVVRVEHNGVFYYFNAINSAQTGNYNDEYGGVVFMFRETDVKIIAPGPSNCASCNGYVVYLGGPSYSGPPALPKKFKSGHVRVRAWRMCEFGKPKILTRVSIGNIISNAYGSIGYPPTDMDMLILHVHLNNSYITHSEGTASVLMSTQPFGGLMFAYNGSKVQYWGPIKGTGTSTGNGVPFSAMSGWGITGDYYYEQLVEVQLFGFRFASLNKHPELFNMEISKGLGSSDPTSFNVPNQLNADNIFSIVTMSPKVPSSVNFGSKFMVPGSTMMSGENANYQYGSLVFGFSTLTIYLWRPPDDAFGCILTVGGLWGNGQFAECSTLVNVRVVGVETKQADIEDVCGGKECTATSIGPVCNCGQSGFDGQFCETAVVCQQPNDHDITSVTYTPMIYSNPFGSNITYTCFVGFEAYNGSSVRSCTQNKTWSGEPLYCERVSCGVPDIVPDSKSNITTITSLKYQGNVTYSCDTGYDIATGDYLRTCQANKTWSGNAPTCNVSCGSPADYGGVQRTNYGNTIGVYANYTCKIGYENPNGSMSRLCQSNGSWSGVPPSCSVKFCDIPVNGNNSTVIYTTTFYQSTAQYTCFDGHVSVNDKLTTVVTSICQDNKSWSPNPLTCAPVVCPIPPVGSYVASFEVKQYVFQDNVTYQCVVGFMLGSGDLVRTCQANGSWSGNPPNCQDIVCPQLGNITNGRIITTGYVYGSQAVTVCNDGYAIQSGDMVRTCDLQGLWVGPTKLEAQCKAMFRIIFKPSDVNTTDTYNVSDFVIDTTTLSRYRRSKTSTYYNHTSHIAIGTLGIAVIVGVSLYICSLDLIKLTSKETKKFLKKKESKVYKVYVTRK